MIAKLRKRVEECFKIAERHYGREKIPRPRVKFDLTGVEVADSDTRERVMRFNVKLAVANEAEVLSDWVPHEVAHFVNRWKHGYGPKIETHGREWRKIMIELFHVTPRIHHKFDVTKFKRKTKEYEYVCGCPNKTYSFGAIKHKRIKGGGRVERCAKCGQSLEFKGKGLKVKKIVGLREEEIS